MSATLNVVEKKIHLSAEHADRLNRLAQIRQSGEDSVIEKALDVLFALTEREEWSFLSEASLQRVWDNEEDAVYNNWTAVSYQRG